MEKLLALMAFLWTITGPCDHSFAAAAELQESCPHLKKGDQNPGHEAVRDDVHHLPRPDHWVFLDFLEFSSSLGLETGLISIDQEKAFGRFEHQYL